MSRNAHVAEPFAAILNEASPAVRPVFVELCPVCRGDGFLSAGQSAWSNVESLRRCRYCGGSGRIAIERDEP